MGHTAAWGLWVTYYATITVLPIFILHSFRIYGPFKALLISTLLLVFPFAGINETWFLAFVYAIYQLVNFLRNNPVFWFIGTVLLLSVIVSAPYSPLLHEELIYSQMEWLPGREITREWSEIIQSVVIWFPIISIAYVQVFQTIWKKNLLKLGGKTA